MYTKKKAAAAAKGEGPAGRQEDLLDPFAPSPQQYQRTAHVQHNHDQGAAAADLLGDLTLSESAVCSLTIECVLLLENELSWYRMCSL